MEEPELISIEDMEVEVDVDIPVVVAIDVVEVMSISMSIMVSVVDSVCVGKIQRDKYCRRKCQSDIYFKDYSRRMGRRSSTTKEAPMSRFEKFKFHVKRRLPRIYQAQCPPQLVVPKVEQPWHRQTSVFRRGAGLLGESNHREERTEWVRTGFVARNSARFEQKPL